LILVDRPHLATAVQTHVGLKRRDNEDRHAIAAFRLSRSDPTLSLVAIVADGVGGHRAGEVAAQVGVDAILRFLASSDGQHPVLTLQASFQEANQRILDQATGNPDWQGMSTTAACTWIIGDRLYIASVGDSRIYLCRGERIWRLTTDHTWVQEAVDSGALLPEDAHKHFVLVCIIASLLLDFFLSREVRVRPAVTPGEMSAPLSIPSVVPTALPPADPTPLISITEPGFASPGPTQTDTRVAQNPATYTPWPTATNRP